MGCGGAECLKFSEYDINSSYEDFSGHAEDNSNVVRTRRQLILVLSANCCLSLPRDLSHTRRSTVIWKGLVCALILTRLAHAASTWPPHTRTRELPLGGMLIDFGQPRPSSSGKIIGGYPSCH
jgi:hypothetical protein